MRKMTEKQDDALDRKAGIKENSPRDMALDAKRGLAGEDKPARPARSSKMTEKQDDAMDRKQGIKENSPRDMALDAKRGLAGEDKPAKPPRGTAASKTAAINGFNAAGAPSGMVAGPGLIRGAARGNGR